jgi:hypothetical protein
MVCRDVRQLADAFLSEQLLVETTQAIVTHLGGCRQCDAEIDGARRLRAATRSAFEGAPELQADPAFAAALASRLQRATARERPARQPGRAWMAIAAGLLLAIGAGWGWREWSSAGLSALLRAAVGDHRFCALTFTLAERPLPLEEAAHRYDPINRLFENIEPSTPTLSGGPLRIVERHSCVFDGRRFAHIVLRYKHETVSLLVAGDVRAYRLLPGSGSGEHITARSSPVAGGFQVASFRGPRHVAFIVTSLAHADAQEVTQALAGPLSEILAGG